MYPGLLFCTSLSFLCSKPASMTSLVIRQSFSFYSIQIMYALKSMSHALRIDHLSREYKHDPSQEQKRVWSKCTAQLLQLPDVNTFFQHKHQLKHRSKRWISWSAARVLWQAILKKGKKLFVYLTYQCAMHWICMHLWFFYHKSDVTQ